VFTGGTVGRVGGSSLSGLPLLELESDSESEELSLELELESIPFAEIGEGTFFILLMPLLTEINE
jgi:hypothetical protein